MEIKQLTFTRFIAAFVIILFHYGQNSFPFNTGMLHHFARESAFAVSYFFCLSGYILSHVYYGSELNNKQFFIKRIARIYPLYFTGFIVVLISIILLFDALPKGSSIILQLLGLHAWAPGMALEINYPSWSLSVELFFYACFPFLIKAAKKISFQKIIASVLLFWIISGITHILLVKNCSDEFSVQEFILYNPLFHLNAFIFGIGANIIVQRIKGKIRRNDRTLLFVFLMAITGMFFIVATDNPLLPWGHNGLFAPLFVAMIIPLHLGGHIISRIFSLKIFIFAGEISYAMYILQHPVRIWFEEFMKRLHITTGPSAMFYTFLAVLIIISSCAFLGIEKPLRKKLVKRFS
jgi:peptidoglycan/LPS O-acetylase OafA/YrhL